MTMSLYVRWYIYLTVERGVRSRGPYLDGLVYLPVFDLDSLTDAPEEVDQELALETVVHHHCRVGNVQHYEPNDSNDHQNPPDQYV